MKSNFVKYIFFIIVIIVMGFAIYQINRGEDKEPEEVKISKIEENEQIKEITLGIAEYDTINPILSKNKYVQEISKIIYDSLLEVDEEYKIKRNLAKDWAKTSGTTYLLKLRDDVKWSNGQPLTIEDVIYTIDILKRIPSIYAYNVQYITRVDKVDETTIQITIDHEIAFFEYNLIFPIMSKNYYQDEDFANSTKNEMTIGTGKYKIVKNDVEGIVLDKNENFKGEELTLETINIDKYSNLGELYNAFKLGKVDIITTDNINISNYIGTIGYNIKESPGRDFDFVAINTQNAILSHTEVRKAILYAINRENIIASVYNNKYKLSNYPLDYGNYLKGQGVDSSYNIDKAREILETSGWNYKNNKWQKVENYVTRTINLKLIVQATNQTRITIADMIKSNLEELGINISIIKASDAQYQSYLQNRNYDMILTGTRQSASPNLETYFGEGNLANYNNEEVKTIMNEVKNITKEDLLKEKYERLRQIYNDENPYISLYNSYYAIASNWNLKGNITTNWYNIFMDINNWYKN